MDADARRGNRLSEWVLVFMGTTMRWLIEMLGVWDEFGQHDS